MKRPYGLAVGVATLVALGAGLMFFVDPRSGARRRATVRDRSRHLYRATAESVRRVGVDVANRTSGLLALASGALCAGEAPTDEVLLARVRSRIGHVIDHPHAIEVKTDHGAVSLAGTLPSRDAQKLLKTVAKVRGVTTVENHLAIDPAL